MVMPAVSASIAFIERRDSGQFALQEAAQRGIAILMRSPPAGWRSPPTIPPRR